MLHNGLTSTLQPVYAHGGGVGARVPGDMYNDGAAHYPGTIMGTSSHYQPDYSSYHRRPGFGGGSGGGGGPGRAYESLGYDYQVPTFGYSPTSSWSAWDLAREHYGGGDPGFDRGWLDSILSGVGSFFGRRRMRFDDAREAHRKIYYYKQVERNGVADVSERLLGGAAAFQAFL